MIALTDPQFVALFGFLGTLAVAIGSVGIAYLRSIHRNTNSLVERLVTDAEKKGDKAGYDRAQQEQKDTKV